MYEAAAVRICILHAYKTPTARQCQRHKCDGLVVSSTGSRDMSLIHEQA